MWDGALETRNRVISTLNLHSHRVGWGTGDLAIYKTFAHPSCEMAALGTGEVENICTHIVWDGLLGTG